VNPITPVWPPIQIGLKLTAAEREIALEALRGMAPGRAEAIAGTPAGERLLFTAYDLVHVMFVLTDPADNSGDGRRIKRRKALAKKIESLIGTLMSNDVPAIDPSATKQGGGRGAPPVSFMPKGFAQEALAAAAEPEFEATELGDFVLQPAQREMLLRTPGLPPALQARLAQGEVAFTKADIIRMTVALAEALPTAAPGEQTSGIVLVSRLVDHFESHVRGDMEVEQGGEESGLVVTDTLYQFKITLKGTRPPVWRRIQVPDGTLHELHAHIQTAMGWNNAHIHEFIIGGKHYAHPDSSDGGNDDFDYTDEWAMSEVLPKGKRQFRFTYLYDFGDHWEHEVLWEGCPPRQPRKKYPLCVEGERACPPEDIGGVSGYAELLVSMVQLGNDQQAELRDRVGEFRPDKFSASQATKAMRKGLPEYDDDDWW